MTDKGYAGILEEQNNTDAAVQNSVQDTSTRCILKTASVFSGAGGFDLGFQRADFKTYFANELLETAAQTLAANLNMRTLTTPASPHIDGTPLLLQGSIADVSFSQANGFEPDVLIGGPPCQDYSVTRAGHRKGLDGTKGKLYAHFIRTVVALHPKIFVFENVDGLVNANKGKAIETILDDLAHLSQKQNEILGNDGGKEQAYDYVILFSGIVDATKFGVPQTRRRLIIIGLRQDLADRLNPSELQNLKDWTALQMNGGGLLIAKYPLTCLEVLEGKPLTELADKYREIMKEYEGIWNEESLPAAQQWRDSVWNSLSLQIKKDYLAANQIEEGNEGEYERAMAEHIEILAGLGWLNKPVSSLQPKDGTNKEPINKKSVRDRMYRIPPGENHEFVLETPWHVEGKGISFIYRRTFPLKPAPTVMAYGGGGTYGYHYERSRSQLTLREKARIQTFTDDFLFSGKVEEVRAQIGEAVPPLMAEKIAHTVREILKMVGEIHS